MAYRALGLEIKDVLGDAVGNRIDAILDIAIDTKLSAFIPKIHRWIVY